MRVHRYSVVLLAAISFLLPAAFAADYYPLRGLAEPAGQVEAFAKQCAESPTPELLTTTGWLFHLYRNENQKARELFEKALDAQPDNPWARYGLCVLDEMKADFDSVLSNSLLLCESSPAHPLAVLAVLNLRGLFGEIANFNSRVEPSLQTVLAEGRSGSVQFEDICREILSGIRCCQGDDEGLKHLVRARGYITEWRVAGPFGEFPDLSFLSKWPPESERALKRRYEFGKRVLKRKRYSSDDGWLEPHWLKPGVYYAEAFLRSPSSQDVILKISSYSAAQVFLDNHCIYTKDTIRTYRPFAEYVRVRLSPGHNRLLLKFIFGTWATSTRARYKDIRYGCPMSNSFRSPAVQVFRYPHGAADIRASASPRPWQPPEQAEHSGFQPSAVEYFSELHSQNPRDPLASGLGGILQSIEGDVHGAKRLLAAAVERCPTYPYFNYVLGVVTEDDSSLPFQIARSEARSRFESALAAAGTFPLARYQLALLDLQDDKELEAMEKLNQCIAESPGFFSWHAHLYRTYAKKEWANEQERQLERILGLGLETCAPYHLAETYYVKTKQYDKLAEAINKLQKTHIHPDFLARHYFQTGQDEKAVSEYLKLKAAQPEKENIRRSLIDLYKRNGRWDEAEKELKEAMKLFPKNLAFPKDLAEVKGYSGRRQEERRLWRRVLRKNPADRDARKALEAYGVEDLLDEFDIPSSPYIHDESIREKYAGVSSALIIDQSVDEIHPKGSSRQKTHQLILLNDRNAIDDWGELSVPGEQLLEVRTIKKDGTVVEPEHPQGSKSTYSMGGLQEGDFIEFEYVTTSSVYEERTPRFLGQRFFFQSVNVPMKLSQYVVVVPDDTKLEYEQVNFSGDSSVFRKRGKEVYKWEVRDVPAVPDEPLAAPDTEFLPFVRVGVNYDADEEILRYQDHDLPMTRITDEIREATARILAGCPKDPESRVRAVYSFVSKEIRGGGGSVYLGPPASNTLADRRGDRLALAKAMLDAAGIESRMLVAREQLAPVSEVFPGSYTSALLGIPGPNGGYAHFLDFSSRFLPFGYITSSLQGGTAIRLKDFASSDFGLGGKREKLYEERIALPRFPIADNCEQRTLDARVAENGSIEATQIQEYTGDGAARLREGLVTAEAYQVKEFVERMANASFRAAALTYHKVRNLSDPEKPLGIEYGFRAPNFARVVGNEMLLDQWVPLLRLGARFASLETRKSPLQIETDFNTGVQAVLKIPSGAAVKAIPPPLRLEGDFGSYHLVVVEDDGSVRVEVALHLKAQRISPQDYPRFAEFCRAVDAAERKEIKIRLQP